MLPTISGEFRIGSDVELKFGASGTPYAQFRAVASQRKKNDSGEWVDDKELWVSVTCFKQLAENVAGSLGKGNLVLITGKLSSRQYQSNSGENRTSIDVTADFVGPSLAFNTVTVAEKVQRQAGAAAPAGDPWATPPQQGWQSSGQAPF